jgi:anti-sigma factor RsiW
MMNCETFHDLLHEYLDETLGADAQAFARQHLRQCDACRRAFLREQVFAKAVRLTLERATAGISVHPQMRQNVIRALEPKPAGSRAWWHGWPSFAFIRVRSTGVAAAFLTVILLILGLQFHRREVKDSAPKTLAQSGHYTWVITVPMQTQIHVFLWHNGAIEDAVVSGASVGCARFSDDRKQPSLNPSSHPL